MKKEIEQIPGEDGWWKSSSQESFERKAKRLKELGMNKKEIIEFLTDLYWDVANCYGG